MRAWHKGLAKVRRHGGVELILDVMRQHEEAGELQSAACGLLWKLSVTDAPTRKLRDVKTRVYESEALALTQPWRTESRAR